MCSFLRVLNDFLFLESTFGRNYHTVRNMPRLDVQKGGKMLRNNSESGCADGYTSCKNENKNAKKQQPTESRKNTKYQNVS